MKNLITLALTCIAICGSATHNQPGTLALFIENGKTTIYMSNHGPNQAIWMDALETGGDRLVTSATDKNGNFKITFKEKIPAFALVDEKWGDVEFDINTRSVSQARLGSLWNLSLVNKSDVEFVLMKSKDNHTFEKVKNLGSSYNDQLLLSAGASTSYYRIVVVSKTKGFRYHTKSIKVEKGSTFNLYPTITSGKITMDYLNSPNAITSLRICDLEGTVVKAQILNGEETLFLGDLKDGMYLLNFIGEQSIETKKIVISH